MQRKCPSGVAWPIIKPCRPMGGKALTRVQIPAWAFLHGPVAQLGRAPDF